MTNQLDTKRLEVVGKMRALKSRLEAGDDSNLLVICGRGYLLGIRGPASYAYSWLARACTSTSRPLAHELRHNLGVDHDWYESADAGAFTYSKGHVSIPGRFTDVMATYNLCRIAV
jgi:hypothetical protein